MLILRWTVNKSGLMLLERTFRIMANSKTFLRLMYGSRCAFHNSSRLWKENDISRQKGITAGIIVIGDEVLKGQVSDTNSHFIAKHLTELGVKVEKISVIGDDVDVISQEVRQFSDCFTHVITTGGIGPTHDDLTYEGVAKAFGETTQIHPEIEKIIACIYQGQEVSPTALKFAHIPASAKLTYGWDEVRGRKSLFPSVGVRNVHIFPGVPNLMERLFKAVYKELFGKGCKQRCKKDLYVSEKEFNITEVLNSVVAGHPEVTIGSYPTYLHSYYDVHITLESEEEDELQKAYEDLKCSLPQGSVVDYDIYPLQGAYEKIKHLGEKNGNINILNSLNLLDRYCKKYKPEDLCIFLTREVESLAALHLLHAVARKDDPNGLLRGFCVPGGRVLPEVNQYMKELMWRYTIQCKTYDGSLDAALTQLLAEKPVTKAIIFGLYVSDTKSESQQELERVSSCRSEVEWINVLEHWKYDEVWDFVCSLYLPYCSPSVH